LADSENFLDLTGTKQLVSFAEETFEIATGAS